MANQSQILCGASLGKGKEYMVKSFKTFSYKTYSPMIMKLGKEHYELKLYKVYINDDPELTLTYFTTMSNLAKLVFVLIVGPDTR